MLPGFWERIVEILGQAYKATTYDLKTHLDGYDQGDLLAGKAPGEQENLLL